MKLITKLKEARERIAKNQNKQAKTRLLEGIIEKSAGRQVDFEHLNLALAATATRTNVYATFTKGDDRAIYVLGDLVQTFVLSEYLIFTAINRESNAKSRFGKSHTFVNLNPKTIAVFLDRLNTRLDFIRDEKIIAQLPCEDIVLATITADTIAARIASERLNEQLGREVDPSLQLTVPLVTSELPKIALLRLLATEGFDGVEKDALLRLLGIDHENEVNELSNDRIREAGAYFCTVNLTSQGYPALTELISIDDVLQLRREVFGDIR
ncbi:MAG: hypothetical protein Q7S22_04010 [Candidatus Micrarchaeota archaeon]|nr:hypothetical protein [Candidatus Micrarchaeota archaeon]